MKDKYHNDLYPGCLVKYKQDYMGLGIFVDNYKSSKRKYESFCIVYWLKPDSRIFNNTPIPGEDLIKIG